MLKSYLRYPRNLREIKTKKNMQTIINRILANNLEDFRGLKMKGTIAISEALVNELIANFLEKPASPTFPEMPEPMPTFDLQKIIKDLSIKNLHLELQPQKMLVNIEVTK
jgi:hypothetical protein